MAAVQATTRRRTIAFHATKANFASDSAGAARCTRWHVACAKHWLNAFAERAQLAMADASRHCKPWLQRQLHCDFTRFVANLIWVDHVQSHRRLGCVFVFRHVELSVEQCEWFCALQIPVPRSNSSMKWPPTAGCSRRTCAPSPRQPHKQTRPIAASIIWWS